jgi:2-polyprenyl-3-methyl-5-hydroxy-6-metoxy-1,4-benzoquinol methylase
MSTSNFSTLSYDQERDEFINRLFEDALGAFSIFSVHIGNQLGFYHQLAHSEGLTAEDLAARTGTQERYVREWLEQQAAACILEVDQHSNGNENRRFRLPAARAEVLTDRDSLNYLSPLAQMVVGSIQPLDALLQAYRYGGGVPFHQYGIHLRQGQASMNRAMFLDQLGKEWLPKVTDVDARLQADPPARVADIGCGGGWSCIGIASSYPKVSVDGYDLDQASVELAHENIKSAGLEDRVRVYLQDASAPELKGHYDLVVAFECIHDMSDPVGALRTMRGLAGENGTVIVMDERAAEEFQPCAESLEKLLYGFSILHCLPVGMVDQPSAGTGTVMRPSTLQRYADEAGFFRVEILPIDNFFFRYYRLVK